MNNLLSSIIIVLLLAIGGYLLFQGSHESSKTVTPTAAPEAEVVTEEAAEIVPEPTPAATSTSATPSVQDTAYCLGLNTLTGNAGLSLFLASELTDGDTISSPYSLRGCVLNQAGSYGNWAPFEAQIGVYTLKASDGTILATGPVPTSGPTEWLTLALAADPIPYETMINFTPGTYTSGTLEIKNENASGEPSNDETKVFTVSF